MVEPIDKLLKRFYDFISPRSLVAVLHISEYSGTKRNITVDAIMIVDRDTTRFPDVRDQIDAIEVDLIDAVNKEIGHRGFQDRYEIGVEEISQVDEYEDVRIKHERIRE